jgi:exopolysaccharide production protein ExoZ
VKTDRFAEAPLVDARAATRRDAVRIQADRIIFLQYLRAAAAFCVLIFHASYYLKAIGIDDHFFAAFGRGFSDFGVFTFFAISGFLMGVQVERRSVRAPAFLLHRLVRIFPLFWTIAIITICLRLLIKTGVAWDPLTFLLAPIGERIYPIGVEWTLVFEVSFYLYTAAIIALGWVRLLPLIGFGWLAAIFVVSLLYPHLGEGRFPDLLGLPLSAYSSAFAAGLVIPWSIRLGCVGHPLLAIGFLLFAGGQLADAAKLRTVCSGVGCAMIVAWAITLPTRSVSRLFHRFGDWSYATYLVHVPIILAVYRFVSAVAPSPFVWLAAVGVALFTSALIGPLDVMLYRRLKRGVDRLAPRRQMAICAGFLIATLAVLWSVSSEKSAEAEAAELMGGSAEGIHADQAAELDRVMARQGYANSSRIEGKIDPIQFRDGQLSISGWASDLDDGSTRPTILAIQRGRVLFVATPALFRSDVMTRLGLPHSWMPAAFTARIMPDQCSPASSVTFVAINLTQKTYRVIDTDDCPTQ